MPLVDGSAMLSMIELACV